MNGKLKMAHIDQIAGNRAAETAPAAETGQTTDAPGDDADPAATEPDA